jgi:hypothetical protein
MNELGYRFSTQEDVSLLAKMNQQLIRDEGHRNKMTLPQLQERMSGWLQKEYAAVIFSKVFRPRVSLDTQLGDNVPRKEYCLCPRIRTDRLSRSER